MKKIILMAIMFALTGCASWERLSEGEKVAVVLGTTILVGAAIIANSNDNSDVHKICISTRSIQTGCGNITL